MYETAEDIIALRDRERANQMTFRSLWQETADLVFPRENQIITTSEPGTSRTAEVYDLTAVFDSQDMASDLSAALIPAGMKFFGLKVGDERLMNTEVVSRYLAYATERTHEEMFDSNFMLQLNESLRSDLVFGTCNLFSEWGREVGGLNYKDFDIAMYQILENSAGRVDTVILSMTMTARQAKQEFGEENLGEEVRRALEEPKTQNKPFGFIHYVGPREDGNPQYEDSRNMPFRSVFVDVKDKVIVEEGGFREFPFAVARWMKSSSEVYGRGQGTEILREVRVLQQIKKDFVECGNKWNNPPLEVVEPFEGEIDMTPGALNMVQEKNSIQAIQQQALGSFPITKDMLEYQQGTIHKAFYRDIFALLSSMKGVPRMTTKEVQERLKEGMRRLASPVARLQAELLDPVITRSFLLLIRNGRLAPPPPELEGQKIEIEYMGELALALRDQQAKGFLQFVAALGEMAEVFPEVADVINLDAALPDIAHAFGVKTEHIATEEQIAAKRQARQQQLAAQQAIEAGAAAAQAAGQASKKPEEGSPVAEVMAGLEEG